MSSLPTANKIFCAHIRRHARTHEPIHATHTTHNAPNQTHFSIVWDHLMVTGFGCCLNFPCLDLLLLFVSFRSHCEWVGCVWRQKKMRTAHDFHLFKSFQRQRWIFIMHAMISGDSRSRSSGSNSRPNTPKDGKRWQKMVKMKSTTIFPLNSLNISWFAEH